jgi:serine/threonine-protein kinase RsbW
MIRKNGSLDGQRRIPQPVRRDGGLRLSIGVDPNAATTDLLQIRIPSMPAFVGAVRQAVDVVSEQLHLPADARNAVKLAVGEACNNAVSHGRRSAPCTAEIVDAIAGPMVLIVCRADAEIMEIDVVNESAGGPVVSNASSMPSPESLAEHGRGMALMEMVMDSVEYTANGECTVVRMRKRRTQTK